MNSNVRSINNGIKYVLLPLIALLIVGNNAYSHEGKSHDASDSSVADINNTQDDSILVVMDSIYGLIQNDYNNILPLFQRSCFDCHSNQTDYPWYYKLPFVKDLIDDDIAEARKHLDMSEKFPFGGHGKPSEDLEAIKKVLEEGEMPPFKYKMLHWNAGLSKDEIETITIWINNSLSLITANSQVLIEPDDSISIKE